ncbi:hypothetical protein FE257_003533 [Aspergillus nanangensis]|uniref:F-box domain-containing protein n=1 Tax=Aspergillus nanangensis TaxID=2582783 RepID=A0AAD4CBF8_ASPNN|nr:hypothetical protein FE257_003533 [Aspergillus nanangensis]
MAATLLSLPNELLLQLGETVPDGTLYNLILTNRHLSEVLTPVLWKFINEAEDDVAILPFASSSRLNNVGDLLTYAIGVENMVMVQKIRGLGGLDYETYGDGMDEALQAAIRERKYHWVEFLLNEVEKQENTFDPDMLGEAVRMAASIPDLPMTQRFLRHGTLSKTYWIGACQQAMRNKNQPLLNLILDQTQPAVSELNDVFIFAVRHRYLDMAEIVLERGADVNFRSSWLGETSLQEAAKGADLELLQWLLDHGADVNVPGLNGRTAVSIAAPYVPVLELLARHAAHIPRRNEEDLSPLLRSTDSPCSKGFEWLLAREGGFEEGFRFQPEEFEWCIRALTRGECAETISLLLDRMDWAETGERILFHVQSYGKPELLNQLIMRGVSLGARCNGGRTILHCYASSYLDMQDRWDKPIFQVTKTVLEKRPEGVFEVDEEGNTPLHVAVVVGNMDVVKAFLEHGALPLAVNKEGDTPLELAQRMDNVNVVNMLNKWMDDSKGATTE